MNEKEKTFTDDEILQKAIIVRKLYNEISSTGIIAIDSSGGIQMREDIFRRIFKVGTTTPVVQNEYVRLVAEKNGETFFTLI